MSQIEKLNQLNRIRKSVLAQFLSAKTADDRRVNLMHLQNVEVAQAELFRECQI
jgi:hypothetical protein